jgi:LysM repeat protein
MSAFEFYLRTGRRIRSNDPNLELKFNPWHDPDDGRFTFAGRGRYFGGSGARAEPQSSRAFRGGEANRGSQDAAQSRSSQQQSLPKFHRFDPRNPANYSTYTVARGDTLTAIAARRKGLTVAALAWLNGIRSGDTLSIGQQLKVPKQSYLDAGRAAKNNFVALAYYIETRGSLPPNAARAPSPSGQIPELRLRREIANGYVYEIDGLERTHRISGQLVNSPSQGRSRLAQSTAGRPDRLASDHGGHFIARRFNGPTDQFNHFAQDAAFNRGAYAALEQKWAAALRAGEKVWIDIRASYEGISRRPALIVVTYKVGNVVRQAKFRNVSGGQ